MTVERQVIHSLLIFIDSSFAEQCPDNIKVSSNKCQCTGVEMEGLKLDIVILEAKFNKQSDALETDYRTKWPILFLSLWLIQANR